MRALVIQHDHVSPPGPVADRLAERGIEPVLFPVVPGEAFTSPGVQVAFPAAEEYDVIVPMGAPWSAYDLERVGSWVLPEIALLAAADRAGVPVLGICFGGQLLAQAHGGAVSAADHPEIGWVEIRSDDPCLVPTGPWFQWHGDRWQVPPGAVEVARTDAASQAFVLRRNLAVQFHPELTADMLRGWLDNGGHRLALEQGVDPEALHAATVAEEAAARRRAHALVDAFLDRI